MIGGPAARLKMSREGKTMFETKRENIFESEIGLLDREVEDFLV